MGGRLRGWRFLRLLCVDTLLSTVIELVDIGTKELFLALDLRWTLVGSGSTGIVILPVELPLGPSRLLKAVFFFSIK